MSQTTDHARGRADGSTPKPGGQNSTQKTTRKATRKTTPPAGSAHRSGVPSPPKRRRPALTALAVLLIVGGAALAGLLAIRMDSREPVLVVNSKISVGEQITAEKLSSTNVSGDGLTVIPVDQADQVVDTLYARQTLYPGQPLQPELLRTSPPLEDDQAQVGVPLTSGKFPPGLRSGDAVRLVRIGDAQSPSQALCTGLVLEVSKSGSGGFGSDAKSSVATVVVPQSVADQVVGATGTDELGIALIDRGIGVDDADISDLSQGRN
jgi:hypothetical protein